MTDPGSTPRPDIKPRPAPIPDPENAEFWHATADGRLLLQRCTACGHFQLYPRAHCLVCRATVEWADAAGTGTIYSYTVIRQNPSRSFRHLLPLVVALVDLDEGPRVMTNIVGSPVEAVRIGARVRVQWEPVAERVSLPLFSLEA